MSYQLLWTMVFEYKSLLMADGDIFFVLRSSKVDIKYGGRLTWSIDFKPLQNLFSFKT